MIAPQLPTPRPEPYGPIDTLLGAARRRGRRLRLLLAAAISVCAAVVLALAFAALMTVFSSDGLRLAFWACEAAACSLPAAIALLWPAKTLRPSDARLHSLLRSAVELRDADLDRPESPSGTLILAHARFASERLAVVDLQKSLPARSALLASGVALGAVCLLVAAAFATPLRQGLAQLLHRGLLPQKTAVREPITGDIELTYLYPAHTHLASRTVTGTSGEIEAPAGTQVHITTRADRPVQQAELVVNGKALPLAVTGDRTLAGTLLVEKAGSYFFRFNAHDRALAEGAPIAIALQADVPPEVVIESPGEDLEVEPKQVVTLRFRASDDYGLTEARLRYRLPGATEDSRVTLQRPADAPLHLSGETRFDLAPLHLAPGDRLSYAIEVLDNDGVAGPKVGQSRSQTLHVFSAAEHHREALAQVRALWERLVELLADRLEDPAFSGASDAETAPAKGTATDSRALVLTGDLAKAASDLHKDPQSPKALWQALSNIARGEREKASETMDARDMASGEGADVRHAAFKLRSDSAVRTRLHLAVKDESEELERDVLYLESLLDRQAMDDLLALTREMAARRRDLTDLVDRYRKNKSPELRAEILAQIERLKARQAELLARWRELSKEISDEHLNMEAAAQMQKQQDLGTGLDQAEQKLAAGDIDGALKELDSVGNALEEIQRNLSMAADAQGASQGYPEITRKLSKLKQGLAELAEEERHLQSETEKIKQRARQEQEKRAPASRQTLEKLEAETKRAQAELAQIPEGAFPYRILGEDALSLSREKTDELLKALQVKDLDQALHSADQALHEVGTLQLAVDRDATLRGLTATDPGEDVLLPKGADPAKEQQMQQRLRQATPLLRDVREALAKMFPDEKSMLSPEEKQRLSQLSQEQGATRQKQAELQQTLREIGQQAPVFDPAGQQAMDESGAEMRRAQESLAQHRSSDAAGEEQGALQQLDKLQQAMKGSGKGQGGGGIPNPFAMSDPSGAGENPGDGSDSADREKVVIPGADQYRVPAEFRRDILDAMKQKAPQAYEEEVKKYYREIVK